MKNKIWMTVLVLFCLGVGLLSGGCAAPYGSQRDEPRPLVGGAGPYEGDRQVGWPHPKVSP
jgi:hypothetical protein